MDDLWLPPKPAIIIPSAPRKNDVGLAMMLGVPFLWNRSSGAVSVPITFLNSITGHDETGSNITLSLAGMGLAANDVVVLLQGDGGQHDSSAPSGYTELDNRNNGGNDSIWVGYKRMTGSPDSSVVCVGNSNDGAGFAAIAMGFRGVNATTAIDVTTTVSSSGASVPNPAAITPVTNGCCIVVLASARNITPDASIGTITNYSTPINVGSEASSFDSVTLGACYRILVGGAGVSEDPAAFSSWASAGNFTATVALRPS